MEVIEMIRDAPGHAGFDIGGTLLKVVFALPEQDAPDYDFPEEFGESGRTHKHLEFTMVALGERYVFRFLSALTEKTEQALTRLRDIRHASKRRRPRCSATTARALTQPAILEEGEENPEEYESEYPQTPAPRASITMAKTASRGSAGGDLTASRLEELDQLSPSSQPAFTKRSYSGWSDAGHRSYKEIRRAACAGGGASKYASLFLSALRVEFEPVKELSALVEGLMFLHEASACIEAQKLQQRQDDAGSERADTRATTGSCQDPRNDIFTIDKDGTNIPVHWPDPLFPFILVSFGSGVSILRVDSAEPNDYVRVGGTACGGGTFLGLARALTSADTFEEALALAEGGDATRADKLVHDIYGHDGCAALGLPGNLTACNFGKLCGLPKTNGSFGAAQPFSENDLARATLQMVTQQSALLSSAFGKQFGCTQRMFFVGGFVDETNWIARMSIANNFRNLGGCAYFLRHSDFLGALGSLRGALYAAREPPAQ